MPKAVLVSNDCPYCDELKKHVEKHNIKVKLIDVDTKEGAEFAEKHGIERVPECVVVDGDKVDVCSDGDFKKLLKGEDNEQ